MIDRVESVRLGVDFGTSHTVAVVSLDGRETRPLLFDGSPLLPSAVCVGPDGRLLVGRDALHTSLASPEGFEPYPKRRIDDATVLLGETEATVERLIGAVLERVAVEAARTAGAPVTEAVLTFPAAWGPQRRGTLLAAAASTLPAGVRLVPEPVAAAHRLVGLVGDRLPVGASALVYDFGAGTFDASVVRRTGHGFEVLATEGLPDCGGLDIDAAVVGYFGTVLGGEEGAGGGRAAWARVVGPATLAERRAGRQLWDNVRAGKEMLARSSTTIVHVPLVDTEVPLGREQLDQLAAPVVDRTVQAVRDVLVAAGLTVDDLAAILLTGSASRMPLVTTVLHRAFGIVPTMVDHPELVVAEGSLRTPVVGIEPSAVGVEPAPLDIERPAVVVVPEAGRRSRRRLAAVIGAPLALILVVTLTAVLVRRGPDGEGVGRERGAALAGSPSVSASPTATPTPSLSPGLDPCLIGSWIRTSNLRTNKIDNQGVQFSGGNGIVQTFRPNGTLSTVFKAQPPGVAVVKGVRWEEIVSGRATATYRVSGDGRLLYSSPRATGTWKLTRNGKVNNSGKLSLSLEPEHYNCAGDTLVQASSFYSAESTRMGASG